MINKRRYRTVNNKKKLYKAGKRWLVLSTAVLGAIGVGAAAHSVHAASLPAPTTQKIQNSAASQNTPVQQSSASQTNTQQSQSGLSSQSHITNSADQMHQDLLNNAASQNHSQKMTAPQLKVGQPNDQGQNHARHQTKTETWGSTSIKFVSDGDNGNGSGDVAIVQPGGVSDAYTTNNDSDITPGQQSSTMQKCYLIDRSGSNLYLPFDADSSNWTLKFAPGAYLQPHDGITKGDQVPQKGQEPDDVDYQKNVQKTNDFSYMLSSSQHDLWDHFKTMDLSNLDVKQATSLSNLFAGDNALQKVVIDMPEDNSVSDLHSMFASDRNLKEVDIKNFNTSNVHDMSNMFASDLSLPYVNVGNLNTQNVSDMNNMFNSDATLQNVDGLSNWNTSNVKDMHSMFNGDHSLKNLNLHNWNTGSVTNMSNMFAQDNNLKNLDLSSFNTRNVTDMSSMFVNDAGLNSLDLSNFDTHNIPASTPFMPIGGMSFMFSGDNSLSQLKLGPKTDLNRANQEWNAPIFSSVYTPNGTDATVKVESGQQPAGTYYAEHAYDQNYINNVMDRIDNDYNDPKVQKDSRAQSAIENDLNNLNKDEMLLNRAYTQQGKVRQAGIANQMKAIAAIKDDADNTASSAKQPVKPSVDTAKSASSKNDKSGQKVQPPKGVHNNAPKQPHRLPPVIHTNPNIKYPKNDTDPDNNKNNNNQKGKTGNNTPADAPQIIPPVINRPSVNPPHDVVLPSSNSSSNDNKSSASASNNTAAPSSVSNDYAPSSNDSFNNNGADNQPNPTNTTLALLYQNHARQMMRANADMPLALADARTRALLNQRYNSQTTTTPYSFDAQNGTGTENDSTSAPVMIPEAGQSSSNDTVSQSMASGSSSTNASASSASSSSAGSVSGNASAQSNNEDVQTDTDTDDVPNPSAYIGDSSDNNAARTLKQLRESTHQLHRVSKKGSADVRNTADRTVDHAPVMATANDAHAETASAPMHAVKSSSHTGSAADNNSGMTLPKTGDDSSAEILGSSAMILGLLGMLGADVERKKRHC